MKRRHLVGGPVTSLLSALLLCCLTPRRHDYVAAAEEGQRLRGGRQTNRQKKKSLSTTTPAFTSASSFANTFPSLQDTLEMATLSRLVYIFHNEVDDAVVCPRVNSRNITDLDLAINFQWTCHWYYHDRQQEGTQVMLLTSATDNAVALVYAGTDDLQTSLTDATLYALPFAAGTNYTLPENNNNNSTNSKKKTTPTIRVHAGFDQAVFDRGHFDLVLEKFALLPTKDDDDDDDDTNNEDHANNNKKQAGDVFVRNAETRYWATGHSLGAAAAVLAAVGLTEYHHTILHDTTFQIQVVNFGCPRLGNLAWRHWMHAESPFDDNSNTASAPWRQHVAVWRIVLGWDLVPRLPELFYHSGHTIQLQHSSNGGSSRYNPFCVWCHQDDAVVPEGVDDDDDDNPNNNNNDPSTSANATTALAYYQHYGSPEQGYAGVPFGWTARTYIWVPGALASHGSDKYWKVLKHWHEAGNKAPAWVSDFVRTGAAPSPNNNHTGVNDDDQYVDPPDDDVYARATFW